LLEAFRRLPAFPDALPALQGLRSAGIRIVAFSNGTTSDVESLLTHNGLRPSFDGIVSLMDVQTYKPDPVAYEHLKQASAAGNADVWLVSGNPFDVIGAISGGLKGAWVRRGYCEYDPWEFPPTATIHSLIELPAIVSGPRRAVRLRSWPRQPSPVPSGFISRPGRHPCLPAVRESGIGRCHAPRSSSPAPACSRTSA
jgi:2-haloacid dehalogenase